MAAETIPLIVLDRAKPRFCAEIGSKDRESVCPGIRNAFLSRRTGAGGQRMEWTADSKSTLAAASGRSPFGREPKRNLNPRFAHAIPPFSGNVRQESGGMADSSRIQ